MFKIPTYQQIGMIQRCNGDMPAVFQICFPDYIFCYILIGQLVCFVGNGQKFNMLIWNCLHKILYILRGSVQFNFC
jgi:hypothetical protein